MPIHILFNLLILSDTVNDVNSLIIYIALAAVGGVGTLGGAYIKTLTNILKARDAVIESKDDTIMKLLERLHKNMLLMGDVTKVVADLNGEHKEFSKEIMQKVSDLYPEINKHIMELKSAINEHKK